MSDSTVGLPTIMPEYESTSFWHNSYQRYGFIDYEKFARVNAVYTSIIAAIAAPSCEKINAFLPAALTYSMARLTGAASVKPPRPGICEKKRLEYLKNVEIRNVKDFKKVGADDRMIDYVCEMIENYVKHLNPVKNDDNKENTPVYDSTENIVPLQTCIGIPHDFARVPLEKRWHPVNPNLFSRVFSAVDGKKNLKRLITEAEWEEGKAWSERDIADYIKTLEFMAEFGYIAIQEK